MSLPSQPLLKRLLPWLILAGLILAVAVAPLPAHAAAPAHRTIRIEAGNFNYSPGEVRVNQGDTVTIELIATDVVHGIHIDTYGLEVAADPGQTARLTFIASRPGTFRLRCSVTCGALHPFMIGKLYVSRNGLFLRALAAALLIVIKFLRLF
jgi:heme/copper-type cytochrome/quinol oxidase subunit 2